MEALKASLDQNKDKAAPKGRKNSKKEKGA